MRQKRRPRYKITIEDESRLEILGTWTATRRKFVLVAVGSVVVSVVLGAGLALFTPARRLFPGVLTEGGRTVAELQVMRVDSLRLAFEANNCYLENLAALLGTELPSLDDQDQGLLQNPDERDFDQPGSEASFPFDSLLSSSPEERRFQTMFSERERYNISVVAPLAGESLMFRTVNSESIFTTRSRSLPKGELIMARGATVGAIADGTVIAVSQSLRDGGSTVIIQHPKGFVSRLSRLGTMLVEVGETVKAGQSLALTNTGNARKAETVAIEMWFDGDPLIPYEYIGTNRPAIPRFPVSLTRRSKPSRQISLPDSVKADPEDSEDRKELPEPAASEKALPFGPEKLKKQ